jgi:DsbC/DsbD-like thiol-disulfide interchange protein
MPRLVSLVVSLALVAALVAVIGADLGAQAAGSRRPQAEVMPVVLSDHVTPGSEVRLALKVRLPPNIHVQSDKPRDPLLIPTVLTIDAPAGVTLGKVVYPAASDLKQAGQKKPLAVFEHEFELTINGRVATEAAKGERMIPGRLRYQACNAQTCFPPASADVTWTLTVE